MFQNTSCFNFRLLIFLLLLFHVGCGIHRCKFRVGSSVPYQVSIEDFIEIYLDAKCQGELSKLCLLCQPNHLRPTIIDYSNEYSKNLKQELYVCNLLVDSIHHVGEKGYMIYVVYLRSSDPNDSGIYECHILEENNALYVKAGISRLGKIK